MLLHRRLIPHRIPAAVVVGRIIGKKGARMREISIASGATIQVTSILPCVRIPEAVGVPFSPLHYPTATLWPLHSLPVYKVAHIHRSRSPLRLSCHQVPRSEDALVSEVEIKVTGNFIGSQMAQNMIRQIVNDFLEREMNPKPSSRAALA